MNSTRRLARQHAMQILFQLDLNEGIGPETALQRFASCFSEDQLTDEYTRRLVEGVFQHLSDIDGRVAKASERWKTTRMPAVDRNILRLATYELVFCADVPGTVSVNEAIELAKSFGSENSPSFVNGVLDKIKQELNKD